MARLRYIVLITLATGCLLPAIAPAKAQAATPVRMIFPRPDTEITAKHPDIQVALIRSVDPGSLIVMVDDTDITAALEQTEQGFHCLLPFALSAGEHTIYIAGNSDSGLFEREIRFSSRQNSMFDEAATSNDWTLNLQAGNVHGNHSDDFTTASIDSILQHESAIRKGNWQLGISGNVRFLEQSQHGGGTSLANNPFPDQSDAYGPQEAQPRGEARNQGSMDPERQGLDLNTILMRAQYQDNTLQTSFELGDLQVVASKNTYEFLARNGGQLSIDYHNLYLNGFSVFGKDTFGLHDGFGIGFDTGNHVNGFSGGVRLLEKRIDLRGFYLDGGQKQNSYSSWSQEQKNSGRVYGFVLSSNFLGERLTTEFEYDRSDFDPDSSDEFNGNRDEAWRAEIGGQLDLYSYSIIYERFGPDYDLPGNLAPKKDYQGITANGSAQYDEHIINIVLAGYHNNVNDNPTFSRINSLSGQFDYIYSGFPRFPLGFSYQHTSDLSTDDPLDSPETNLTTDTIGINLGYMDNSGIFSLDTSTSYSWQNDDSDQDADLAILSFTLAPALNLETFSMSMSATLNQSRDLLFGVRTDDYVLSLDTMGSLFEGRVSYELGGTYDHTLLTDNSGDRHGFTGYSRINYHLPWLMELTHSTISLELQYNSDAPQGVSTTEDIRVFCTLSTSIPFNY
ncbi:hypothetical protein ACLG6S_13885 [Thermodesulfobacteriota bacterium B35]